MCFLKIKHFLKSSFKNKVMPTGSQREINFIVVGLWAMHFKHVNSFNSLKYITSGASLVF